ncbi:MAG TPA: transposase, partial [Thermoanaerobaculia bacterium]|nr:transposase [Thermoanaerobaculia bacterium]
IGRDPRFVGGKLGVLAILHTWTQTLEYHPHVHCLVPGGGLGEDGCWVRPRKHYLAPVRVLSRLYRGKVVAGLRRLFDHGRLEFRGAAAALRHRQTFDACLDELAARDWVVYCKRPFGRPATVLGYLARYTHRVAISNDRLLSFDGERVVLGPRDRATSRPRRLELGAEEFIRRFLLHVLPPGFVRIRTYGLLANRHRRARLAACRTALGQRTSRPPRVSCRTLITRMLGRDPGRCPSCGAASVIREPVAPLRRNCRGPPDS